MMVKCYIMSSVSVNVWSHELLLTMATAVTKAKKDILETKKRHQLRR